MKELHAILPTLIRAGLKIGGGALIARGVTDASSWETVSAFALALTGILWGYLDAHKAHSTVSLAKEVIANPALFAPIDTETVETEPEKSRTA